MTYQQKALLVYLMQLAEKGTTVVPREKQSVMDSLVRNQWVAASTVNDFKVYTITNDGVIAFKRHEAESAKRAALSKATSSAARASA